MFAAATSPADTGKHRARYISPCEFLSVLAFALAVHARCVSAARRTAFTYTCTYVGTSYYRRPMIIVGTFSERFDSGRFRGKNRYDNSSENTYNLTFKINFGNRLIKLGAVLVKRIPRVRYTTDLISYVSDVKAPPATTTRPIHNKYEQFDTILL